MRLDFLLMPMMVLESAVLRVKESGGEKDVEMEVKIYIL